MSKPRSLYFIDRGPRPAQHRAPYHRYIICTRKHTAQWEAGWSGDHAWIWSRLSVDDGGEGFLLVRWNGLDIDYGHVVRGFTLPDGTSAAFCHPHTRQRPWNLLSKAVWWSDHDLPDWLAARGVKRPQDSFSLDRISEDVGTCLLSFSAQERLSQRREVVA